MSRYVHICFSVIAPKTLSTCSEVSSKQIPAMEGEVSSSWGLVSSWLSFNVGDS